MSNTKEPRYSVGYRQDEISLICNCARQGQSLCFVGVAGTGKSNITNFLRHDPYSYKSHYLGEATALIHFPVVDGNTWAQTPQSLWRLLFAALYEATEDLPQQPTEEPKIIQLDEEQRALSELKARLKWLCQELNHQVMFILDDFDQVIQLGPLPMLEELNTLRTGGNRNQLSYLLFTKRLPQVLGQAHPLKGKSKFYDLFSGHIYALPPYNHTDARQMLSFLNDNAGKPLSSRDFPAIENLAGGHAQLLRVIFTIWSQEKPENENLLEFFCKRQEVHDECTRIMQGLHEEEQDAALRLARGAQRTEDQPYLDHLARRGLLTNANEAAWFSPIFAEFLRTV